MINTVIKTKERLDNLAWDEFLRNKGDNAKYWYSLRRRCKSCKTAILDDNPTGYCKKCEKSELNKVIKRTYIKKLVGEKTESKYHIALKEVAKQYLTNMGCVNIKYEKRLGETKQSVVIDVYGELNNKKIAIECGSNRRTKLNRAKNLVDVIYILPYHETIPYEWNNRIKFCQSCGHIISDTNHQL